MIARRSISQRVRVAILARQDECCAKCGNIIAGGKYEIDHIQALEHGGDNEPSNLRALCSSCHRIKTRKDHRSQGKVHRLKAGGKMRKGPPMMGTKASGWQKHMDGTVTRR